MVERPFNKLYSTTTTLNSMLNLNSTSKHKLKYNYQNNYNPLLKTCPSLLRMIRETITGENLLQTAETSSDITSKTQPISALHSTILPMVNLSQSANFIFLCSY
jgi:hypothetical protein